MSASDHDPVIGKTPLIASAVLMLTCIGAVGAVQAGWAPKPEAPAASPEAPAVSREVRFEDQPDGSVVVRAVGGGRDVVILPDSGGFLRGVARTLTRDRKMRGLGPETPFVMSESHDGALSLSDPATGRTLKLDAFGPDNRAAFRDLLHQGAA